MDRYSYTDIDDPKDYHRIPWQYWQQDPEGEYVSLDDIQGSNYSGGSHTMANYHAVKEMFQDCQAMWDITGDYDSYGLMFHWPSLTDEEKQRLEEIEESLDNYPILDEQEWCEVEQEWIDEAWNNWLEWDVQRYLNRLFEQVFPGLLEFERNENLRRLTEFFMEKHNQYYEFETGNGAVVVQIKHIFPDAMELLASPALVWADKIFLED